MKKLLDLDDLEEEEEESTKLRHGVRMPQEFEDKIVKEWKKGRSYRDIAHEFNISTTGVSNAVKRSGNRDVETEHSSSRLTDMEKRLHRIESELWG